MKEQIGKYFLDISKLVFGGVVIAAVMKESFPVLGTVALGGSAVIVTAALGFLFIKYKD